MRILKNLSLILLLALAFAGCRGKSSKLADFDKPLYTPAYAFGFEIVGAENAASTIVKVHNPWQGAEGVETGAPDCPRRRDRSRGASTDRCSKEMRSAS